MVVGGVTGSLQATDSFASVATDFMVAGMMLPTGRHLLLFELVINNLANTVSSALIASSPAPVTTASSILLSVNSVAVRFMGSPSKILLALDD